MQHIVSILASGDDAIAKILIGVIVFIFWGISSIASALKKNAEQNQRRRVANELPIELTPRMEVGAARPAQRGPRMVAAPVAQPPPRRVAAPPLAPPISPPMPATARAAAPRKRPGGSVSPATPGAVSPAAQLAQSLRPESLRARWLLTEILAKPLALRETDALGPR
jgi:hypothetical protein